MVCGNATTLDHETSRYPWSWVSAEEDHTWPLKWYWYPDAVDDLITWLEGNRRQEVVVHQLADQVGNVNPGQYITPKVMFPSYTLPGGSWHTFILGKIWGAIRGFGEIFSTIFGLFIVGRLIWYLIKVLMNCGFIHSAHGCSPHLAWSFCMEVLFTLHYRKLQRRRKANVAPGRSDTDPSERPLKRRQTIMESIKNVLNCSCIDDLRTSDSDKELRNSPAGEASSQEMAEIHDRYIQRQGERLASARKVRSSIETLNKDVGAFKRLERSPPPYVTPPSSNIMQSKLLFIQMPLGFLRWEPKKRSRKGPAMCPILLAGLMDEWYTHVYPLEKDLTLLQWPIRLFQSFRILQMIPLKE